MSVCSFVGFVRPGPMYKLASVSNDRPLDMNAHVRGWSLRTRLSPSVSWPFSECWDCWAVSAWADPLSNLPRTVTLNFPCGAGA